MLWLIGVVYEMLNYLNMFEQESNVASVCNKSERKGFHDFNMDRGLCQ